MSYMMHLDIARDLASAQNPLSLFDDKVRRIITLCLACMWNDRGIVIRWTVHDDISRCVPATSSLVGERMKAYEAVLAVPKGMHHSPSRSKIAALALRSGARGAALLGSPTVMVGCLCPRSINDASSFQRAANARVASRGLLILSAEL
jgi:hypothetical protein